jgi:hypothetical protein
MRNQLNYIGDDTFRTILQFCQFDRIIKITNINHQTKSINKKEIICKYLDYIENNDNIIKLLFFRYIPAISICCLSESLISSMSKIKCLKHIQFYGYNITESIKYITPFIQSIGQFKNLETLILSHVAIGTMDINTLSHSTKTSKRLIIKSQSNTPRWNKITN